MGRPTRYSRTLAAHIAAQLASGHSLAQVLAEPGMPTKQTVYSWLHVNQEFIDYYGTKVVSEHMVCVSQPNTEEQRTQDAERYA